MARNTKKIGITVLTVVIVGALLAACKTPIVQAACDGTLITSNLGTLQDPELAEASGLAASALNPGTLWANNDSGDTARLFAITEAGATRGTYTLSGATAIDWEDLSVAPGPVAGRWYLYAADIGDNAENRANVVVYRVAEPVVSGTGAHTLTGVEKLTLQYPDGVKDAEAFMVDPWTGQLFIIQKSAIGGSVGLYRAPANLAAGSTTVLTRVATITLPAGRANAVTASDIAVNGNSIAIRTYGFVRLWSRVGNQTVVRALAVAECRGPVPVEGQGETIAFRPDATAYYTVGEAVGATLHRFDAPAP